MSYFMMMVFVFRSSVRIAFLLNPKLLPPIVSNKIRLSNSAYIIIPIYAASPWSSWYNLDINYSLWSGYGRTVFTLIKSITFYSYVEHYPYTISYIYLIYTLHSFVFSFSWISARGRGACSPVLSSCFYILSSLYCFYCVNRAA